MLFMYKKACVNKVKPSLLILFTLKWVVYTLCKISVNEFKCWLNLNKSYIYTTVTLLLKMSLLPLSSCEETDWLNYLRWINNVNTHTQTEHSFNV